MDFECWNEGRLSWECDMELSANPHEINSIAYFSWMGGWYHEAVNFARTIGMQVVDFTNTGCVQK